MATQEQIEQGLDALRALAALRVNAVILSRRQINKLSAREFNALCKDYLQNDSEAMEMVKGKEVKEYILAKKCLKNAKLEVTQYMLEVYKKSLIIKLEKEFMKYDLQEMQELYPNLFGE